MCKRCFIILYIEWNTTLLKFVLKKLILKILAYGVSKMIDLIHAFKIVKL